MRSLLSGDPLPRAGAAAGQDQGARREVLGAGMSLLDEAMEGNSA